MKKILICVLAVVFAASLLSACSGASSVNSTESGTGEEPIEQKNFQIVTTIFPEYDWVKNLLGDNPGGAEVTMLLDSGVDLHSFQPTAEDILKIANCDIFIYVGGESDEWVEAALKENPPEECVVINLLDVLGDKAKEEEIVEGMQSEHEHGEEEHGEEAEFDEHVWLSLKNAEICCEKITEGLCQTDPENAETYQANASAYAEKLASLDKQYEDAVYEAKIKTLLFGDRFPFRYLTDDYGITYYAAFVGCSAETEASFETITFLAGKMDELGLTHIMTIEGTDHSIAETIAQNAKTDDITILSLDSMQSTTANDVKDGADYLDIMENNLEVLKEALN